MHFLSVLFICSTIVNSNNSRMMVNEIDKKKIFIKEYIVRCIDLSNVVGLVHITHLCSLGFDNHSIMRNLKDIFILI